MTKAQQISSARQRLKQAGTIKEVSMQQYSLATQIESEALSELQALGAARVPARKGINELPPDMRLDLIASMTR